MPFAGVMRFFVQLLYKLPQLKHHLYPLPRITTFALLELSNSLPQLRLLHSCHLFAWASAVVLAPALALALELPAAPPLVCSNFFCV
jgi:hypothetical protein